MRIRQQLIMSWVIVILFSVTAIGCASIWITYHTLHQTSVSELENISKTIKITANSAVDISIKNYLRAVSEKNLDVVKYFYQQYEQNLLTKAEATQHIREVLLSHYIGHTGYNFVYDISEAPEQVICEIHPKVQGLDVAKYDFAQTAFNLKNGYFEYQWQNPDEAQAFKKAMYVSYFEPWQWIVASSSYKHEFINLVNKDELIRQLSMIQVGNQGYIFILDVKGNMIYHPRLKENNVLNLQDDQGKFLIKNILLKKEGFINYRWRDPKINQFTDKIAILNYIEELDWIIVTSTYADDVIKPVQNLLYVIVFVTIVTLVVGITAIILMVTSLTEPLFKMTTNVQKIAEGESNNQLLEDAMLQRTDEVGNLARSFNSMVNKVELRELNLRQAELLLREYNLTLEDKVKERTDQLEKANQEIYLLNCHLQADNMRMSAELHVTRRLQQMLLPDEKELSDIEDLKIASFMQPADEVGGDYYDVLKHNGHIKIGIGDVTGHGLESSVIMVMLQTCVRTLLTCGITDPTLFLAILNRTLYDNLNRINSDKNLTLVLLDYQSNGILTFSGQHEEILVVRECGKIERIDTIDLGFFIGIESDITEFIGQLQVTLNHGDGVVLYTDGITEARNDLQQQYGVEQLCQVISQNWHQPVNAIKQLVISDLRNHIGEQKLLDDITLIVLKRT